LVGIFVVGWRRSGGFDCHFCNSGKSWKPIDGLAGSREHKQGHAYQIWQSLLAFGSGGLDGLGLGNGRLKINYLPERQTDFIFAVIGEELGMFISIGVISVFAVLVACGLYIAWNARDRFGFLAASGITLLIGMQALINMAVVTNLLPNKGLSLAFHQLWGLQSHIHDGRCWPFDQHCQSFCSVDGAKGAGTS
jgi:hypothetical protein